jgi:hypothetical protein
MQKVNPRSESRTSRRVARELAHGELTQATGGGTNWDFRSPPPTAADGTVVPAWVGSPL